MPQASPTEQDRHSPTGIDDNPNRHSVGLDGSNCGPGRGGMSSQEQENVNWKPGKFNFYEN